MGSTCVVADSALYSADHVGDLDEAGIKFLTRIPETIGEAERAVSEVDLEAMKPLSDEYRGKALCSTYGDARQRWLLVWSEEAEQRAIERAAKQTQREHAEEKKAFRKLGSGPIVCWCRYRWIEVFSATVYRSPCLSLLKLGTSVQTTPVRMRERPMKAISSSTEPRPKACSATAARPAGKPFQKTPERFSTTSTLPPRRSSRPWHLSLRGAEWPVSPG